ncbi:DUF2971 domain-containing protein [Flavobacteriaceae bacterium KMM 6897]|nr:DUF2971 domain-containing protein [Flavobacteriaceae bacterium KMM 6897]
MKIYKFKSGINDFDFESLTQNYYWASNVKELNDVFESTIDSTQIDKIFESLAKMINKDVGVEALKMLKNNTNEVLTNKDLFAIFSTSTDFKNELLWAHYANSHKGFCIEYDLELLRNVDGAKHVIINPIKYIKSPPKFNILDLVRNKENNIAGKVGFHKSKAWEYEKELRILTMKNGKVQYPFNAITGVYFGINSSEKLKNKVKKALQNHSVNFYEMKRKEKSYLLTHVNIHIQKDENRLHKILSNKTLDIKSINPKILSYKLFNFTNIGNLKITVNHLDTENHERFKDIIKSRLFPVTERFFLEIYDESNNQIY